MSTHTAASETLPPTSLAEFADETRADLDKFVADYKAKHAESPERYPLSMAPGNEGLWFEFFLDFCTNGSL